MNCQYFLQGSRRFVWRMTPRRTRTETRSLLFLCLRLGAEYRAARLQVELAETEAVLRVGPLLISLTTRRAMRPWRTLTAAIPWALLRCPAPLFLTAGKAAFTAAPVRSHKMTPILDSQKRSFFSGFKGSSGSDVRSGLMGGERSQPPSLLGAVNPVGPGIHGSSSSSGSSTTGNTFRPSSRR